jgi:hypothetical protein
MRKKVSDLKVILIGKPDLNKMPKVEFDIFISTLEREISEYYNKKSKNEINDTQLKK